MKTLPITATIYLEREENSSVDVEVLIDAFYTPREPDVYNLPNGDPGYPGHPAVNVATGETVGLTAGEIEQAEEAIREEAGE